MLDAYTYLFHWNETLFVLSRNGNTAEYILLLIKTSLVDKTFQSIVLFHSFGIYTTIKQCKLNVADLFLHYWYGMYEVQVLKYKV